MAKRLVDDTIITEDTGENRMYEYLSDKVRLRSGDEWCCVLEVYRKLVPVGRKKNTPSRLGWSFAGYYPTHHHVAASYKIHKRCKEWSYRKRDIPVALKHMLGVWNDVWSHIPEDYHFNKLEMKITEMKQHEKQKRYERGQKKAQYLTKAREATKAQKQEIND